MPWIDNAGQYGVGDAPSGSRLALERPSPDYKPVLTTDPVSWVLPIEAARSAKLAALAAKRYGVETAGIAVAGVAVSTDRDSRAELRAKIDDVAAGRIPAPIAWKAPAGFVVADLVTLQAWDAAIAAHVQAAFDTEAAHAVAIQALTDPQAVIDYDISTGWGE